MVVIYYLMILYTLAKSAKVKSAWEKWVVRKAHEEAVRRQTQRRKVVSCMATSYEHVVAIYQLICCMLVLFSL